MTSQVNQLDADNAMIASLQEAMTKAHGLPFNIEGLATMSALDLIFLLAPNDIRFCYVGEDND